MKRCLVCDNQYSSSITNCPTCGAGPTLIDGFYAYAPDFAHDGGGFNSNNFSDLARLEEDNFWFRYRNQLILWSIKKYYPVFNSFLEIGCGTGYVLSAIAKEFPNKNLYGSEIFTKGLSFSSARLPFVNLMQMDARRIPYISEFDAIGAFDVLEHIEEDEQVLAQIYSALKPRGIMLLTVPQHPWLWSATDERACHVRRYVATDLVAKVKAAGFHVLHSTSFVTILLPAMIISRFFKKKVAASEDDRAELEISPWLNLLFSKLLHIELVSIRSGISFPVGGSRLIIAKRM